MAKHFWHNLSSVETAKILKTDFKKGLSEQEVEIRYEKFGLNKLPKKKGLSKLKIFLSQFKSPLIYILIIAGVVTFIIQERTDSLVIFGAVVLNTIVGYFQEVKASNALKKLREVLKIKAIVLRQGKMKEILQEELVPGDVIVLKSGNKVPADARIIESLGLKINESALTGEWLRAEKISSVLDKDTPMADCDNMAYMGTIVEAGEGIAIVTETGSATEIGKVAVLIKETKEQKTPYQKKISRFSKIISLIITIVCLIILFEGIITGVEFKDIFIMAIAVAVAAVPEGLPVAMTVILALGMQRILKKKGLVRKLASAETLGSTSIICTDKTLTLTEGKMEVSEIKSSDKNKTLEIAVLCNEAFIENPEQLEPLWRLRGRPTDKALILAGAKAGINKEELEKKFPKINEIPFNSENKFIATLHNIDNKESVLLVSGAPEKIIELSSISEKTRLKLNKDLEGLTARGLRVIGVGYKRILNFEFRILNFKEEIHDLTFVGFIGLKDPLRQGVKEAIRICKEAGMRPIIVTGDHLLTAKAVAKELDLVVRKENMIEGKDLDKISDEKLDKLLNKINLFARVEPKHKLRIVRAWQEKNQVVAMTGDGVNDAPALKKADIAVALGSGTDVAKEVADIVLLDDNFSVIVAAIEQGRAILDNIRKVITYLLSSSFTEIILIGGSLLFGFPLPVTAIQILWVNLIEDGLPSIALAFEPKEKDLLNQKPQKHNVPLLTKEMKALIFIIGLITDVILLGLFFWLWTKNHNIAYVRTMIFACLSIDSIFYVFACKSLRKNIWNINIFSNMLLVVAWFVSVIFLFAAIYLPFLNTLLKTVPLGIDSWLILFTLGLFQLGLIEATKYYFIIKRKTCSGSTF